MAAHVLFIHDRPDWLLLAILAECRHLDIEATVIGHRGYRGFGRALKPASGSSGFDGATGT